MGDCSTEDLCQACLASGRRLFSINTLKCLLTGSEFWEIINKDGGVCWECKSTLHKFSKLKNQAQYSQLVLAKASEGLPIVTSSRLSVNTSTGPNYYYMHNDASFNIHSESIGRSPPMNTACTDSNLPIKQEACETTQEFDVSFSNVFVADLKTKGEIKVDKDSETETEGGAVKDGSDLVNAKDKTRRFSCDICSLQLKSRNSLRCHVRRIHAVKREFTCEVCKRTFASKSRFESHCATHGGDAAKQLAYCATCHIQYKNIYIYRLHLRTSASHQIDYVECPECKKRFANKTYFKRHYSFFHLNTSKFKCDQCNKLFISVTSLKSHNDVHHTQSRERKFACELCTKRFHTVSSLRKHRLIHSEERNYMCTHCGDTFKQNPALYMHIRLKHQGHKRPPNRTK